MNKVTISVILMTLTVTYELGLAQTITPPYYQRLAFSWQGSDLNNKECDVLVNEVVDNSYPQVIGLKGTYNDSTESKTFTIAIRDSSYRSPYRLDPYSSPDPSIPIKLKGVMDQNPNYKILVNDGPTPILEILAHDSVVIKRCVLVPIRPIK